MSYLEYFGYVFVSFIKIGLMLPTEFAKLMGRDCSWDEFVEANAVYMETSLNKEDFVKDWKKHKHSKIIKDLFDIVIVLRAQERPF